MNRDKIGPRVSDTSRLVFFLYIMMRDHWPPGHLESILMEIEGMEKRGINSMEFSNGFLAQYAREMSKFLKGDMKK